VQALHIQLEAQRLPELPPTSAPIEAFGLSPAVEKWTVR
jgi:hypothetical protein